ncbi:putative reverse transcriptase domain-containing protein [Tanacetum coccineum]|uniref:Reverse transcriptase domain-containing protein n=1 Tax=Tanacetum coccineum TaxID=301880 RepID=A0ABQ4WRP9_9ASTR
MGGARGRAYAIDGGICLAPPIGPPPSFSYPTTYIPGPTASVNPVGQSVPQIAQQAQSGPTTVTLGSVGHTAALGQATTLPYTFTTGTLHDPTTGAWNMDTVPTGSVVTTGSVIVPTGSVIVPTGSVVTTGSVIVPAGSVIIPTGSVVTTGSVIVPAGSVIIPTGSVVTTGSVIVPAGSVIVPTGSVVTTGSVIVPAGSVVTTGSVIVPAGSVIVYFLSLTRL